MVLGFIFPGQVFSRTMIQTTSRRPRKRQRTSARCASLLLTTIAAAASLTVAVAAADGGVAQGKDASSSSSGLLSTSQNRPGVKSSERDQADDKPIFLFSRSTTPTDDEEESASLQQGAPPLLIARQASATGVKTGAFSALPVAATAALGDGLASLVVSSAALAPTGWAWNFPVGSASATATASASSRTGSSSATSDASSTGLSASVGTNGDVGVNAAVQGGLNAVAQGSSASSASSSSAGGAADASQDASGSGDWSNSDSSGSSDGSGAGGTSGASGSAMSAQEFKALQQEPGVQVVAAQPAQAAAASPVGKRKFMPEVIRKAVEEATFQEDTALERRSADEPSHVLDVASLPFEDRRMGIDNEERGSDANSLKKRATNLDTVLATDPKTWLRANVNLYRNTIASGTENLAFVDDPISPIGSPSVLRVFYEEGSYSLHSGSDGGANFYSQPFLTAASSVASTGTPYTTVEPAAANASDPSRPQLLLTYSVYFPLDFDFVKGGKLPGIYSSVGSVGSDGSVDANTDGCSGGSDSGTGESCWSVRVMWRSGGMGEGECAFQLAVTGAETHTFFSVYAYIPLKLGGGYDLCAGASSSSSPVTPDSILCNKGDYGTSIGRGAFTFMRGQWNQISLYVQVNSPHTANGAVQVFVNGSPVPAIDKSGLAFRTGTVATVRTGSGGGSGGSNSKRDVYDASNQKWVDKIFFSTFFGGSSSDYASSQNTTSYFKDFSVSRAYLRQATLAEHRS
jgi:hypothetical protein